MESILAQLPAFDASYWLALASRILHILGAIVLVGGIAYLRKVVAPTIAGTADDPADVMYAGRRAKWAMWVGIAVLVLLVTGLYNVVLVVKMYPDLPGAYHMLLGLKLLLALVVFFLAMALAGKTGMAVNFRGQAKRWLTICLAAGIGVVILAGVMRSFHLPGAPIEEPIVDAPQE